MTNQNECSQMQSMLLKLVDQNNKLIEQNNQLIQINNEQTAQIEHLLSHLDDVEDVKIGKGLDDV